MPRVRNVTESEFLSIVVMPMSFAAARAALEDPAALVDRCAGVDLVPVVLGQPRRPVGAALLVGLGEQDQVAGARGRLARDPHRGDRERREPALEVHRAAAVQEAVLDEPAERVDGPQRALDPDDVRVAGEQQRLLRRRPRRRQPRDQVRLAGRGRRHDLDAEAERLQPRPQVLGDHRLVPGRVGRVDPDEVPRQGHHLAVLGARRGGASREERDGARDGREPGATLHAASLEPMPAVPGPYPNRRGITPPRVRGRATERDAPAPQ